jgi:hypothetical protein
MLMLRLNNVFWTELLIFRFKNSNLEFKYQFLDQIYFLNLNNNFQSRNVNFQVQIIIFNIEMSIFRLIS